MISKDEIVIRLMDPSECEEIAYIDQKCISNPWTEQDFLDLFRMMENYYYVAEIRGIIVGFAGMMKYVDDADISHVAVLEDYRGLDIATRLMESLIEYSRTLRLKALHLEVRESNEPAKRLYSKVGFEEIAIRKKYYQMPSEDAIVMECKID